MKSEHRHELKTNELADWMAHFPEWAQENARVIIGVVALVVVAGGLYFWVQYNNNVRVVADHVRFSTTLSKIPQQKHAFLSNSDQMQGIDYQISALAGELDRYGAKGASMAALALLKKAEVLRMELDFGQIEPSQLPEKVAVIQKNYRMAIEKATADPTIRSVAKYGLGLCDEELGNFDAAKQDYQNILADDTLAGTVGQAAAEYRLSVFQEYEESLTFKPAPEPEEEESLVPELNEVEEDANTPIVGPVLPTEVEEDAADTNETEG